MPESLNTLNVLIVDDNEDGRILVRHVLQGAGHPCSLAPDADQAMQMLAEQPVDILLTNINLPGRSGLELVKWVRGQALTCEVVVFTAYPNVETAIEALRAGAADYLTQPISTAALLEAVDRVRQRLTTNRQGEAMRALLQDRLTRMTGLAGTHAVVPPADGSPQRHFNLGPVLLDVDRYVIEVNGRRVEATPSELEILHYLFLNPGRVITAQELIQAVRGYRVDQREAPEIVRPHISNLRRKLVLMEPTADIIQTVRSVGYMLQNRRVPGR